MIEPNVPSNGGVRAVGVGVDLVDIERVDALLERHGERVITRLLTPTERAYCLGQPWPAQHIAARLAAKEAAYKALQRAGNARGVGWRDTEVLLKSDGSPTLKFHGRAAAAATALNVHEALVSLTHSNRSAAAVVILNGHVPEEMPAR